jgi:hypothetical protein
MGEERVGVVGEEEDADADADADRVEGRRRRMQAWGGLQS